MTTTVSPFEFDGEGSTEYSTILAQALEAAAMTRGAAMYLAKDTERLKAKAEAPDATDEDDAAYALILMGAKKAEADAEEAYEYSVFALQAYVNAMGAKAAASIAGVIVRFVEDN